MDTPSAPRRKRAACCARWVASACLGLASAALFAGASGLGLAAASFSAGASGADDDDSAGASADANVSARALFRAQCTGLSQAAGGGCRWACSATTVPTPSGGLAPACQWCTTPPPGAGIAPVCVGNFPGPFGNATQFEPVPVADARQCAANATRGATCSACEYDAGDRAAVLLACAAAAASFAFNYALRGGCCADGGGGCGKCKGCGALARCCGACCCVTCSASSLGLGCAACSLLALAVGVARGTVCRDGCTSCCGLPVVAGVGSEEEAKGLIAGDGGGADE